jgi:hypothetical protein
MRTFLDTFHERGLDLATLSLRELEWRIKCGVLLSLVLHVPRLEGPYFF